MTSNSKCIVDFMDSGPLHYWHLGWVSLLCGGFLLYPVGYEQHPWPLPSRMPVTPHSPQSWQPKMAPDVAKSALVRSGWEASTRLRTTYLICTSLLWERRGTMAFSFCTEKSTLRSVWFCFFMCMMFTSCNRFLSSLPDGGHSSHCLCLLRVYQIINVFWMISPGSVLAFTLQNEISFTKERVY